MKALAFAAVAALSTIADAADSEQKPCTAHMCGRQYDLSPLSSTSDYVLTSHSGRNFTLNVCRSVVTDLWNPRVDRPEDVGGFVRGDHGDFSIGQTNSTIHFRNGNPVLYMTDGTTCPQAESMKASTAIQFICDTSVEEGEPKLVAQLPPEDEDACAFFIEWKTKYACPVPDRYAYWKTAVMVIVILLALTLTIVALLAVHKLILKRRRLSTDSFGYNGAPILPNGSGGVGVGGAPRGWTGAIAERARDAKRLLTGQDPWGHPNGYHVAAAPTAAADADSAGARAGTGTGGRKKWLSSSLFSIPWSRSSRSSRSSRYGRLPRNAEEESMMGGGPFSVHDDDDHDDNADDEHTPRGVNVNVNGGDLGLGAEESAAWGSSALNRPRGMDGAGVIRL